MSTVLAMFGTALGSMAMKLMSSAFIEEMIIWAIGKLVAHTDSKADDELYEKVKKQLKG